MVFTASKSGGRGGAPGAEIRGGPAGGTAPEGGAAAIVATGRERSLATAGLDVLARAAAVRLERTPPPPPGAAAAAGMRRVRPGVGVGVGVGVALVPPSPPYPPNAAAARGRPRPHPGPTVRGGPAPPPPARPPPPSGNRWPAPRTAAKTMTTTTLVPTLAFGTPGAPPPGAAKVPSPSSRWGRGEEERRGGGGGGGGGGEESGDGRIVPRTPPPLSSTLTSSSSSSFSSSRRMNYCSDRYREAWEGKFALLRQFKAERGHCNVPQKHPTLGRWVNDQRSSYKKWGKGVKTTLTEERRARLDVMGFVWSPNEVIWEARLEELKKFKARYGHFNVPQKGNPLGKWVNDQRTQYKRLNDGVRSNLSERRLRILEDIGFTWTARDATWHDLREGPKKLKQYDGANEGK